MNGICIWFTGLSGSGKTTTAEALKDILEKHFQRKVTFLDGDVVRTHLSKGLGFSKEDRETNLERIAFVASHVVWHGGIAICSAITPYQETRYKIRHLFPPSYYCEVYVNTPLEVCEERDVKGLYAAARRGEVKNFTGIDDRYDVPQNPDLEIDAVHNSSYSNAYDVVRYLLNKKVLNVPPELTF